MEYIQFLLSVLEYTIPITILIYIFFEKVWRI